MDDSVLRWKGKEYEYQEKSEEWYWVLGIVGGAIIIASILLKSYIFALVVLAALFACGVYAVRRPPEHTFSLTEEGVMIDDMLYEYERIISFAIVEYPDTQLPDRLTLHTHSIFSPTLHIPLSGVDSIQVYIKLSEELQEHVHEDSLAEALFERFKF